MTSLSNPEASAPSLRDSLDQFSQGRIDRRTFLKQAAMSGVGASSLGALLAACGPSAGPSGPRTLTFWALWNKGEPSQITLDQAIQEFKQANPQVTVDALWAGRDVDTKVRTALIAGNPPDLVENDAQELSGAIITPGQAQPLDDVISSKITGEQNTIADVVPKAFLDQYAFNGKRVLVPDELLTSGFFYNQKLFSQLGLEPPHTWSEFLDLVRAVKAKGLTPLAEDNLDFLNAYYYTWLAMRHAGPGVLNKAAGDKSGAGWDNPALLEAATDLEQLVAMKPFEPGYEGSKWPGAQVEWAHGNAAMILIGTWVPGETQKYVPTDWKYRMFTFPVTHEGHDSVEVYLNGFVIPKGAKNADLAKQFITFFYNVKRISGFSTLGLNMIVRKDVPAPVALEDAQKALLSANSTNQPWDGLSHAYPGWWKLVFLPLDDQLFFGKIKAAEFIRQLKQQSVTYWQSHTT